jgi:succinate-acetate transporter protein
VEATTPPVGGPREGALRGESGSLAAQAATKVSEVVADPAPLGLAGFALTTFVLSMYNSGLVDAKSEPVVFGLALAYGGLAQLLAGMWEFKNNNAFGATAFTSYGAFWLSFWAFNVFYADKITDKVALGHGVGLYLIGWGIFTGYMWIASFRVSVAVNAVFLLLTITFILLGIGESGAHEHIIKAGGYVGLATAVAAWYASFATVTNKTFDRIVLPVKDLKR